MPKNILINTNRQILLLGDFPSSSKIDFKDLKTNKIYRVHAENPKKELQETNLFLSDPRISDKLKLPNDYKIYVINAYNGEKYLNVALKESTDQVNEYNVIVNKTTKPVLLVLSSSGPTVWRIKRTEKSNLLGVVADGSKPYVVLGITKETPIVKGNYDNIYIPRISSDKSFLKNIKKQEQKINFISGKENEILVGQEVNQNEKLLYSDDYKLEDYITKKFDVPLREEGINYLLKNGYVRRAAENDVENWKNKVKKEYRKQKPFKNPFKNVEFPNIYPHDTYVVLKEFEVPNGFYSGFSKKFIITENGPKPTNMQNCEFYSLKDDDIKTYVYYLKYKHD